MIEFRTKLDETKFKKLSNFQFKKILLPLILISILVITCGIINIIQKNIVFGVLWIIFGTLYIPCILLITKILQKKFDIDKQISHNNADETYFFNEFMVTIIQTDGKDFNAKGTYRYIDLYKIYKTKTDYIIYLNKDFVRIVPINSLVQGMTAELDKILKAQLKNHFIIKHFSI